MEEAWFTVKQIFPKVYGIAEFQHDEKVISYLFVGNKKAMLFDSGMGIGDIKKEVEKITSLPVIIVNSHCHFDHIGGNSQFDLVALFDSPFSMSVASNGSVFDYKNKIILTNAFSYSFLLHDDETIDVDPFELRVISTPGHTPDSICLYEQTNKLLLTGDTLYPGPIYLNFPESSKKQFVQSFKKIISLQNDVCKILPGHNDFNLDKSVLALIQKEINLLKIIKKKQYVTKISNISFLLK